MVYGKRVGSILTVCTDNNCPVHVPRAAARAAEHPAPVIAPAPETETEEDAEQRRQQYEAQRKAHGEEAERRAEGRRQEEEREEQEAEAEQERREELRRTRADTFERIVQEAPASLSAAQLRVLLRAIVNLDPYTFADDLATELSEDPDNDRRSAEEVLFTVLEGTADDKLSRFAVRLALSGHRGIPRENEPDFLAEADTAFAPASKTKRKPKSAKVTKPTLVPSSKKKGTAKKNVAA